MSTAPFTPKRARTQSSSTDVPSRLPPPRSTTPSIFPPTTKIKSSLTAESRVNTTLKVPNRASSRPPSPTKRAGSEAPPSRPLSSLSFGGADISTDPEAGLVDWQNVEDVSMEMDEKDLAGLTGAVPKSDKVLVSIRVKPPSSSHKHKSNNNNEPAWIINPNENTIKLDPRHARSTGKPPPTEHRFDEVLTGSDNREVYNKAARVHVKSAMEGYNALVFAYGQTASGKTFTLMGDEDQPGIIPRAMKDVFAFIRKTPSREFLLRASYLEIYNETLYDLLSPSSSTTGPTITDHGIINLREEVVTSLKGIKEVMERGDGSRRTACTDWNERSSRSHSVFRLVIESREVSATRDADTPTSSSFPPSTPGGTRLQTRGGRSVQSSVLSLIDLAGSEKATSDKERTREGKYINTSLLTLGTVIGTLAENAANGKSDHIPYRNSKLTRMLQPSLSGNARISVICTLNSSSSAIAETTSTLGFAGRVKRVHLHAVKKEVVDTDALLERYRKEIEELKAKLEDRERDAPVRNRRLSAKQQIDESKAVNDMSGRIRQLTKLILTSRTVDESKGDQSRPASPSKLDFDQSPYELQKQLLAAKDQIERQQTLILSLETTLDQRAVVPLDAPEYEKDAKIVELQKQVKELEFVTQRYEENLGEPLRAVKEDVERVWRGRVEKVEEMLRERDSWVAECERGLEKERKFRLKLEDEKRALLAFVCDLDSQLPSLRGLVPPLSVTSQLPTQSYPTTSFKPTLSALTESSTTNTPASSPVKIHNPPMGVKGGAGMMMKGNLLDTMPVPEDVLMAGDVSFSGMSEAGGEEDKENVRL